MKRILLLLVITLLLTGCGGNINNFIGVYQDPNGFQIIIEEESCTYEMYNSCTYKVLSDNKIQLTFDNQNITLEKMDDGNLKAGSGNIYTKKTEA